MWPRHCRRGGERQPAGVRVGGAAWRRTWAQVGGLKWGVVAVGYGGDRDGKTETKRNEVKP